MLYSDKASCVAMVVFREASWLAVGMVSELAENDTDSRVLSSAVGSALG